MRTAQLNLTQYGEQYLGPEPLPRFEWHMYDTEEFHWLVPCDGEHTPDPEYLGYWLCSKDIDGFCGGCGGEAHITHDITWAYKCLIRNLVAVITLAAAEKMGFDKCSKTGLSKKPYPPEFTSEAEEAAFWSTHDTEDFYLGEEVKFAQQGIKLRLTGNNYLVQLLEPEFTLALVNIYPGREEAFFSDSIEIKTIISALKYNIINKIIVEKFLDRLFESYKVGQTFEYTYEVCAVLFAMKVAKTAYFLDIAQPFIDSQFAEVGTISRFAKRLSKD